MKQSTYDEVQQMRPMEAYNKGHELGYDMGYEVGCKTMKKEMRRNSMISWTVVFVVACLYWAIKAIVS